MVWMRTKKMLWVTISKINYYNQEVSKIGIYVLLHNERTIMKITCVMPRVLLSFDRIRTDSKCVLWDSIMFPWALALYTIEILQHLIGFNEQFSCRPIIFWEKRQALFHLHGHNEKLFVAPNNFRINKEILTFQIHPPPQKAEVGKPIHNHSNKCPYHTRKKSWE